MTIPSCTSQKDVQTHQDIHKIPKELFRANDGHSISLRDWHTQPFGAYDLITQNGIVIPKALDLRSYKALNSASLLPKSRVKDHLRNFRGTDIIIFVLRAGIELPPELLLARENKYQYSLQVAREMNLQGEVKWGRWTFWSNWHDRL